MSIPTPCQQQRTLRRTISRAALVAVGLMTCGTAVVVGGHHLLPAGNVETPPVEERQHEQPAVSEPNVEQAPDDESVSPLAVRRLLRRIDYAESWRQAGLNEWRLGDTRRSHQVRLGADGSVRGRISTFNTQTHEPTPLIGAEVRFLRRGSMVAETHTDSGGVFQAEGLTEGTYGLFVTAPDGLLAYAVHVRDAGEDKDPISDMLQIDSVAVSGADRAEVERRISEYWRTDPQTYAEQEPPLNQIPPPVRPIPQSGVPGTTVMQHRVHLHPDGRLIGRIRRLHPETGRHIIASNIEVALVKNGQLYGQTWTDNIGYFELPNVSPGLYSLIATGSISTGPGGTPFEDEQRGLQHGFLAFAIEVLPADEYALGKTPGVSLGESASSATVRLLSESSNEVRIETSGVWAERTVPLEVDAALVDVADLDTMTNLLSPFDATTEVALERTLPNTGGPSSLGGAGVGGGWSGVGTGLGEMLQGLGPALILPPLDDGPPTYISSSVP